VRDDIELYGLDASAQRRVHLLSYSDDGRALFMARHTLFIASAGARAKQTPRWPLLAARSPTHENDCISNVMAVSRATQSPYVAVAGSGSSIISVWNFVTRQCVAKLSVGAERAAVNALAFNRTGTQLAAATSYPRETIYLFTLTASPS
jgi:WD40 repeat protein